MSESKTSKRQKKAVATKTSAIIPIDASDTSTSHMNTKSNIKMEELDADDIAAMMQESSTAKNAKKKDSSASKLAISDKNKSGSAPGSKDLKKLYKHRGDVVNFRDALMSLKEMVNIYVFPITYEDLKRREVEDIIKIAGFFKFTMFKHGPEDAGYVGVMDLQVLSVADAVRVKEKLRKVKVGKDGKKRLTVESGKCGSKYEKLLRFCREKTFKGKFDVCESNLGVGCPIDVTSRDYVERVACINKLPEKVTEDMIAKYFPEVPKVLIPQDEKGNTFGHAYAEFENFDAKQRSMKKHHTSQTKIDGNNVTVTYLRHFEDVKQDFGRKSWSPDTLPGHSWTPGQQQVPGWPVPPPIPRWSPSPPPASGWPLGPQGDWSVPPRREMSPSSPHGGRWSRSPPPPRRRSRSPQSHRRRSRSPPPRKRSRSPSRHLRRSRSPSVRRRRSRSPSPRRRRTRSPPPQRRKSPSLSAQRRKSRSPSTQRRKSPMSFPMGRSNSQQSPLRLRSPSPLQPAHDLSPGADGRGYGTNRSRSPQANLGNNQAMEIMDRYTQLVTENPSLETNLQMSMSGGAQTGFPDGQRRQMDPSDWKQSQLGFSDRLPFGSPDSNVLQAGVGGRLDDRQGPQLMLSDRQVPGPGFSDREGPQIMMNNMQASQTGFNIRQPIGLNDRSGPQTGFGTQGGAPMGVGDGQLSAMGVAERRGIQMSGFDRRDPQMGISDLQGPQTGFNNRQGPQGIMDNRQGPSLVVNDRPGLQLGSIDRQGPIFSVNDPPGPRVGSNDRRGPPFSGNEQPGPQSDEWGTPVVIQGPPFVDRFGNQNPMGNPSSTPNTKPMFYQNQGANQTRVNLPIGIQNAMGSHNSMGNRNPSGLQNIGDPSQSTMSNQLPLGNQFPMGFQAPMGNKVPLGNQVPFGNQVPMGNQNLVDQRHKLGKHGNPVTGQPPMSSQSQMGNQVSMLSLNSIGSHGNQFPMGHQFPMRNLNIGNHGNSMGNQIPMGSQIPMGNQIPTGNQLPMGNPNPLALQNVLGNRNPHLNSGFGGINRDQGTRQMGGNYQ